MAFIDQERKRILAPGIKAVLKKYGMKGTISIRHHMTLCVNIKAGRIDILKNSEYDHINVNPYWIDKNHEGVAAEFLNELLSAMKGKDWFDKSDIMTDYFHVAWYTDINVGSWNRPYMLEA
jgi:hypothetical protein